MQKDVSIPAIETSRCVIRIAGTAPLVIKNLADDCRPKGKNPVEDFMRSLCWLTPIPGEFTMQAFDDAVKNGARFGYPQSAIKRAAATAAKKINLIDKATLCGAMQIDGTFLEIQGAAPRMRTDTIIAHVNDDDGCLKKHTLVHRAEFPAGWFIDVPITFVNNMLTLDNVKTIIKCAGLFVGIGARRAELGGECGAFEVASVEAK